MPSATVAVLGARPLVRRGIEVLLRSDGSYAVVPGFARVKEVHASDEAVDVLVVDLDRSMIEDLAEAPPLSVAHVVGVQDVRSTTAVFHERTAHVDSLVGYDDEPCILLDAIEGRHVDDRRSAQSRSGSQQSLLTLRETEVLGLIADGLTTRDVSARLGISPRTVENYKQHLFAKLGVQSRAHAVAVASRMGILGPKRLR